eukprot:CAMPEP_0174260556 /NCGR_PEP_ID=MMETSP0439-20130205/9928_1 /TAXON_ID=0 /ORGANISM="Stereomyxa ramosa, Strain Chinc5" /LENGTH=181 /DNA_ID=CAMNT_0015344819 /DNA_START=17 /DNA_END=563 /DNA_ORIENTATION=-
MALFVGRLPPQAESRDLEDLFYKFGRISRCDVLKGYGFVEFEDRRDAEEALQDLDGVRLMGGALLLIGREVKEDQIQIRVSIAEKVVTLPEIVPNHKDTIVAEEEEEVETGAMEGVGMIVVVDTHADLPIMGEVEAEHPLITVGAEDHLTMVEVVDALLQGGEAGREALVLLHLAGIGAEV